MLALPGAFRETDAFAGRTLDVSLADEHAAVLPLSRRNSTTNGSHRSLRIMDEDKNDTSASVTLSDGFGLGPVNPMSPEYVVDAEGYLRYQKPNDSIDSVDFVIHAAECSVTALEDAYKWVNEEFEKSDLTLELKLDDSPEFFAQCSPTSASPRAVTIYVGLGCVPVLVGITNRLLHLQKSGPTLLEMELQGRLTEFTASARWHPRTNPVGTLVYDYIDERNTSSSTVDAILLIFFHEIAHALRGHLWIKPDSDQIASVHRRALESDADWSAGYLFVQYQLDKLRRASQKVDDHLAEMGERLAVASASLNCALQLWRSDTSKLYHLPHVRTRDNLYGAEEAWRTHNLSLDFPELINTAYSQLALLDRLLAPRMPQWVTEDDARNLADEAEWHSVTLPTIRALSEKLLQLEHGGIAGQRSDGTSISEIRPNYRAKSFYSYS